jgi:hypothetical protein
VDRLVRRVCLKVINLKENPLSKETQQELEQKTSSMPNITIHFTPRVKEEWEQQADGY